MRYIPVKTLRTFTSSDPRGGKIALDIYSITAVGEVGEVKGQVVFPNTKTVISYRGAKNDHTLEVTETFDEVIKIIERRVQG